MKGGRLDLSVHGEIQVTSFFLLSPSQNLLPYKDRMSCHLKGTLA